MIPSAESGPDLLVTAMSPAYVRIATFGAGYASIPCGPGETRMALRCVRAQAGLATAGGW